MSYPRKRVLQELKRETSRQMEADSSQPARRQTPPGSPAGSSSPEITVEFVNDSFMGDSTAPRRCGCTDPFCSHRFRGRLDDFQLTQFLDLTRDHSGEIAVEKQANFFESDDTLHIGNILSIRKATDPNDGIQKVYIKRDNGPGKASIIKFPASELKPFLCDSIVPLYIKCCQLPMHQLFANTMTHNYRDNLFWRDPLCYSNPKNDIKIRPFLLQENRIAFRIWQTITRTVEVRDANDTVMLWNGPSATILKPQFLSLIHCLGQLLEHVGKENVPQETY